MIRSCAASSREVWRRFSIVRGQACAGSEFESVVGCCGSQSHISCFLAPLLLFPLVPSDIQNTAHTNVRFLVRASYLHIYSQCGGCSLLLIAPPHPTSCLTAFCVVVWRLCVCLCVCAVFRRSDQRSPKARAFESEHS